MACERPCSSDVGDTQVADLSPVAKNLKRLFDSVDESAVDHAVALEQAAVPPQLREEAFAEPSEDPELSEPKQGPEKVLPTAMALDVQLETPADVQKTKPAPSKETEPPAKKQKALENEPHEFPPEPVHVLGEHDLFFAEANCFITREAQFASKQDVVEKEAGNEDEWSGGEDEDTSKKPKKGRAKAKAKGKPKGKAKASPKEKAKASPKGKTKASPEEKPEASPKAKAKAQSAEPTAQVTAKAKAKGSVKRKPAAKPQKNVEEQPHGKPEAMPQEQPQVKPDPRPSDYEHDTSDEEPQQEPKPGAGEAKKDASNAGVDGQSRKRQKPKATFARRYRPETCAFAGQKWDSIKQAFELHVAGRVARASSIEACLTHAYACAFLDSIVFLFILAGALLEPLHRDHEGGKQM